MNISLPSDFTVSTLQSILDNLYQYGGPILIFLGTMGSIINVIVYIQKNPRENPCLIYFISRNISNFFFIYLSLLYVTLVLGYNIFPSSSNLTYCHFSIYISLLCDILSPFYLILASIDQVLVTSLKANIRKRSTCRLACILSIGGSIFWILFDIHALIYSEIVEIKSSSFHCDLRIGLYSTIVTYYSLIVKGIITPLLLIIFILWAIENIRNIRRIKSIISVINIKNNLHLKDEEIIPLLIKDIIIYIIFTSIMSIVLMYELITQHHTKNFQQIEIEYFIRHLSTFCVSLPFCIGCYTNLIVSKTFRNQVKNIFL
jgi:hypothetical protein